MKLYETHSNLGKPIKKEADHASKKFVSKLGKIGRGTVSKVIKQFPTYIAYITIEEFWGMSHFVKHEVSNMDFANKAVSDMGRFSRDLCRKICKNFYKLHFDNSSPPSNCSIYVTENVPDHIRELIFEECRLDIVPEEDREEPKPINLRDAIKQAPSHTISVEKLEDGFHFLINAFDGKTLCIMTSDLGLVTDDLCREIVDKYDIRNVVHMSDLDGKTRFSERTIYLTNATSHIKELILNNINKNI
ncbi:hypothetical protein RLOatenuis_2850 [Rickettsiales bacterium]|nr:hypothetical protein RLOatenuis_2850 [Rickettsiales bacterium]